MTPSRPQGPKQVCHSHICPCVGRCCIGRCCQRQAGSQPLHGRPQAPGTVPGSGTQLTCRPTRAGTATETSVKLAPSVFMRPERQQDSTEGLAGTQTTLVLSSWPPRPLQAADGGEGSSPRCHQLQVVAGTSLWAPSHPTHEEQTMPSPASGYLSCAGAEGPTTGRPRTSDEAYPRRDYCS